MDDAAFLIPYVVMVVLVGRPLFMSDVALGQYTQRGPLHTWRHCIPAMSGLGVTLCVSAVVGLVVYTIVLAYAAYFIYELIISIGDQASSGQEHILKRHQRKAVLGLDPDGLGEIGDLGELHIHLVLSLLVIWVVVAASTIKGIKSVGKVVYFTATFPFIVLLVLAIAGMTLPGAGMGLRYLFIPQWHKLLQVKVWRVATEQVIFSMSVAGGGLITFGSFNKFNSKIHIDIVILSVLDLIASLLCAVTIFSVLGAMAYELGIDDVSKVVASGPGLAFIAYPEAISRTMPLPHLWSLLFFFMVLTLGLDSMFAGTETISVTITDSFPGLRRVKALVVLVYSAVFFGLGIVFCTAKAQYLFHLMDVYGAGMGALLFCIMKSITLQWGYGVRRFSADLHFMLGYMPSLLLRISWAFIAPITLIALFVGSLVMWTSPRYGGQVAYPPWAAALGWFFALFALSFTPIVFVWNVVKACLRRDPMSAFRPSAEWGPGCPKARARLERMKDHGMDDAH
ncbi:hypothetical protein HAZT_HAZT000333 [Hyalella azteca]|uniref:Uncharacterized protein n=1 Tax=Hyalella azteca TaxID=294128 RepID=A0A6A0HDK2_HYAAZ|nr:hypothetical protein HAZT_HAZT000333 [Hyalella azteca]